MKEKFTVEKDGVSVDFVVVQPSPIDGRKAQLEYNKAFSEALNSGALLRAKLDSYMREQGMWDDKKENEYQSLIKDINDMEYKLKKGGIRLSEAKNIAISMRKKRAELRNLIAERNELDTNTAEGQAENARFNCLVAMCLRYAGNNERVYKDTNDYLSHATDEEAFKGAQILANMMYALDKDFEKNLPENKFLKEYGFVDDELRLVNEDGKLVDENGRLIDELGRYIDENGNLVDINGRPVDENGEYIVEQKPFLDDDGNPIVKQEDGGDEEDDSEDGEAKTEKVDNPA